VWFAIWKNEAQLSTEHRAAQVRFATDDRLALLAHPQQKTTLDCMELWGHLLMVAVLATAEFCTDPIEGGVSDPQLCRLYARQVITTPFFSIVVEPDFLVGVDRQGRRLQVQSTLWKNQDQLTIEVLEESSSPNWSDCADVTETIEDNVTWQECRIASDGTYERRLVARLKDMYILIQFVYSKAGTVLAPALERMTQSIKIHAT